MPRNTGRLARPALSLPIEGWPEADRLAWERVCRPGTRLSLGGAAARWAPQTREDLVRRYGLFLGYLQRADRLARMADTAGLVTPEAVAAFTAELKCRVSSVTLAQTVSKVRRTAELIAPRRDFAWLKEIERDLALVAVPQDKFPRVVMSEHLVEAGLTLVYEADTSTAGSPRSRALLARNGLMIAMLALCPVRRRNFAALELGDSFVRQDKVWQIVLKRTTSDLCRRSSMLPSIAISPLTERSYGDRVKVLSTGWMETASPKHSKPT